MAEVLTFGEVMGTVRVGGKVGVSSDVSLSIAGSEGNVAIGLSRLGHFVRWAGCLGGDAVGDLVVRTLAAEQVDVTHVSRNDSRASGILVSQVSAYGGAKVDYHRHASAGSRITSELVLGAFGSETRILHVTGITPALSSDAADAMREAMTYARERSIIVSFDVNYRSRLWSVQRARETLSPLLEFCDIVIGGVEEILMLVPQEAEWRTGAEALGALGVGEVVVKLGADGAAALVDEQWYESGAVPVPVRDPIGAGDAFVAGYLSGIMDGLPVAGRLHRGNLVGACAVASYGDWEGLPTRDELAVFDGRSGQVNR